MSRPAGDDRVIGDCLWHIIGGTDTGYHQTPDTTLTWIPPTRGLCVVEVATVDVYGRVGLSARVIFQVA
ncbi:hypothetical protein [Actinacidiphila glaucinigra]|uniref:hypothetical protein n=1 Tax=Actinacidiphila glaucinigra TaxID=235986 RepID=UPI00366FDD60